MHASVPPASEAGTRVAKYPFPSAWITRVSPFVSTTPGIEIATPPMFTWPTTGTMSSVS